MRASVQPAQHTLHHAYELSCSLNCVTAETSALGVKKINAATVSQNNAQPDLHVIKDSDVSSLQSANQCLDRLT